MGSYTYPLVRSEGTLTAAEVHAILASPSRIARRVAQLSDQGFIADYLLQGRYTAQGGGVFYETGENPIADESPEAVEPGSEYKLIVLDEGELVAAKTVKWGIGTLITDEKIAREGQAVLDRGLRKLANTVISHVDGVAMSVIASKVTDTVASPAAWSTTKGIIGGALAARADRDALKKGIGLDTVLLNGTDYAAVMSTFLGDGLLPREQGNLILSGQLPAEVLGFNWVTSPQFSGANPIILDREQLGGMADERLGGPGWVNAGGVGVEAKSIRKEENDAYQPQARRVTVPIVVEPDAGVAVTGTGL